VVSESRPAPAGTVAAVFDRKNRFLAAGLYDPDGPIRVRIFVHGKPGRVGADLFRSRLADALTLREGIASPSTTGLRLLHGENDRMPGVVVDQYGDTLVVKIYTSAWLPHLRSLVPALEQSQKPRRILLLGSRKVLGSGGGTAGGTAAFVSGPTAHDVRHGTILVGPPLDGPLPFLESGLHFEAHPVEGHKTGFYLDQRENRRKLEREVRGDRVLNVFAHTGAFSVHAARGGAREVVSLDISAPALAQAERHFALNRNDPAVQSCAHRTLEGDAFARMKELVQAGERFETVIVDPPSFARAAAHRDRALDAYARLTSLAVALLEPGGLLVQASCSSRVDSEDFFARIHLAARDAGVELTQVVRTGHPADHPIGFSEGSYLKCLWARVQPGTPRRDSR